MFLAFALLVILPCKSYGYIDPGTGSYFLQMLIAGILGGLFAIKMFWGRIKAFFLRILGKKKNTDE